MRPLLVVLTLVVTSVSFGCADAYPDRDLQPERLGPETRERPSQDDAGAEERRIAEILTRNRGDILDASPAGPATHRYILRTQFDADSLLVITGREPLAPPGRAVGCFYMLRGSRAGRSLADDLLITTLDIITVDDPESSIAPSYSKVKGTDYAFVPSDPDVESCSEMVSVIEDAVRRTTPDYGTRGYRDTETMVFVR